MATRNRNKEYKEAHTPPALAKPTQTSSSSSRGKLTATSKTAPSTAQKEVNRDRQQRIYRAIYNGSFDITSFAKEVPPRCCVFHGSSTHQTADCVVLQRSLDKASQLRTSKDDTPSTTQRDHQTTTPVAKVTRLYLSDGVHPPSTIMSQIESVNLSALQGDDSSMSDVKSNDNVNPYLQIHNKQVLVDSNNTQPTGTHKNRFILDGGAFPHMFNNRFLFDTFYT